MAKAPSYPTLVKDIQKEIVEGSLHLDTTTSQEKATMFWRIGKRISKYQLDSKDRANYGEQLFIRLSANLDIGIRTLYRAVALYQQYPNLALDNNLGWYNYTILLSVKDAVVRNYYESRVIEENLSNSQLKKIIKNDNADQLEAALVHSNRIYSIEDNPKLPVERHTLYCYKVVELANKKMIDCGFNVHFPAMNVNSNLIVGDLIEITKGSKGYKKKAYLKTSHQLHNYIAFIERVVDGDTVWVNVDLGFGIWIREKLRLRGINTPELDSFKGRKAKKLVEALLPIGKKIVIKTYKSDKYGRFLSDIFYSTKEIPNDEIIKFGSFLNQDLLDQNLATLVEY